MELGLDRLPWYGKSVTFLLIGVADFVVLDLHLTAPVWDDVSQQRQELTQKRVKVSRALQTASELRTLELDAKDLDARFDGLKEALPGQGDASEILRRLQVLATQSNLSIRAFTPQAVQSRELHTAWPMRLELTGTYHNLEMFLDRVSQLSQVIAISDVLIRAIDPPQPNATIEVECTATMFVLEDDAMVAAVEPAI